MAPLLSCNYVAIVVLLLQISLRRIIGTQCPLESSITTTCSHVHCRFPCEPAPHEPGTCNSNCICPKTPEEACKKVTCQIDKKCEGICRGDNCVPICAPEQTKMMSMIASVHAAESTEPGFKPCPVVGCRFPCEPSPPHRDGCSKTCVCPQTVERACVKISCPNPNDCTANCDDCVCIPFCRTRRPQIQI